MNNLFSKAKIPIAILVTFILYYTAAKIGLNLATINNQASPVWPATGIALSAVIVFGPSSIFGVFLAAFLVNFQTGLVLSATTLIAVGNSMEAVVFYLSLRKFVERKATYGVHTLFIVSIFILMLAAATSATVGTGALYLTSIISLEQVFLNWQTWWVGDLLGALILVPITYKLTSEGTKIFKFKKFDFIKLFVSIIVSALTAYFVFGTDAGKPFLFCIFMSLLLVAFWFSSFWIYLTSFFICAYAVYQTTMGFGPFTNSISINDNLIHLQIFVAALAITAMGLGSIKLEKLFWRSALALVGGWTLAGLTFYFSYKSSEQEDQRRFKSLISQAEIAIANRLNDYIQSLDSGSGFIGASDFVSPKEWQIFTSRILAANRLPGINGIGLILPEVPNSNYKAYKPSYDLKDSSIKFEGPEKFIISYIEPVIENQKAHGLNVSSEQHRYQALVKARDSGQPTMSRPIKLVQDQLSRYGFLIFLPVYKKATPFTSKEQRRQALIGFVYAPIVYEKFISSAISEFESIVSLKIVDTNVEAYSSPDFDKTNSQIATVAKSIAGHTIDFNWKKGPNFKSALSSAPLWIAFFGSIFSLLFAIVLSSLHNISNRAQNLAAEMTKEVENRKRMWKTLSELSPIGIYVTDLDENCTYANPAWRQIHEIEESELQKVKWTTLVHPDDFNSVKSKWKNMNLDGNFSCTYRICKNNGEIKHVSALSTALKDDENKITGYLSTILDITDLQRNQTALANSVKMSALGQMAGGLAHEINNPLAILHGKISIIEQMFTNPEKLNPNKATKHIEDIFGTIDRIAKIIRGLSAIAKESNLETFEACEVKTVFENSLLLCQKRITDNGIKLILPESYPDFTYLGRNEQVSQVIINLLYNAKDAILNHPNPWIKIDIQIAGSAFIEISNSGPPISAAIQSKIFDPFFTTKEIGKGMGLGLSVSKGIIERHRGRLYLDTSKSFTTFTIEIPPYVDVANVA